MSQTKQAVARELADAHYSVEPGVVRIVRLIAPPEKEDDPKEPVKLLEANENTTADGIRPVFFGPRPASGICYASAIIEVTPEEFDDIMQGRVSLPNDWRLGDELPKASPAVGR